MIDTHPPPRILAIEPDPQSGTVLYRALDKWVCADVEIVGDIDAALTSIAEQVPDLIMTSTFLPPAALARLNDELRRLPDATHTLIITTPHFLDDAALLGTQVEHYLAQSRSLHEAAQARQQRGLVPITDLVLVARPPDPWQHSIGSPALRIPTAQDLRALNSLRPADRRRASRRRAADLAGQWGLRLSPVRRRQNRGHLMLGGAPRDEHQAPAGEPDRSRGHRHGRQHCRRCPPDQDRDGRRQMVPM